MTAAAGWTALNDQVDAAARDAKAMLDKFAALLGTRHTVDYTAAGPFARELLHGMDERIKRHRQRSCTHLRRNPAVGWLFGWAPERLHCLRCAHKVLAQVSGTVEDSTCDVCRRAADPCSPVMGSAGPIVVLFGACDGCYDLEVGAAA